MVLKIIENNFTSRAKLLNLNVILGRIYGFLRRIRENKNYKMGRCLVFQLLIATVLIVLSTSNMIEAKI